MHHKFLYDYSLLGDDTVSCPRSLGGTLSLQSLGELCHEKCAEVQVIDVDRYKRIVGRVSCACVDANAAQVRRGMAWVYDRYAKDKTLYRPQDEARSPGRGIWHDGNAVASWEWRRQQG